MIRALCDSKSFDVTIIGLSYETLEPGIYMQDLMNKTYQVPYPAAGQDVLFDRIAYHNQKEGIDFLLPILIQSLTTTTSYNTDSKPS